MGQRHTWSVADNMLLGFRYQLFSSQGKSCRCWSAGNELSPNLGDAKGQAAAV
jgi:hypothetical protein